MQKWEYNTLFRNRVWSSKAQGEEWNYAGDWTITFDGRQYQSKDLDGLLAYLGDNGWELVAVSPRSGVLGAIGAHGLDQGSRNFAGLTTEELWVFKRQKS
ncbi:MAG: hypothetical protein QOH93_2655 [Chloroflexia bacterium]|jgi:hypothetical protein|nr:hypothetical protein [Chloroflexia bacterium]